MELERYQALLCVIETGSLSAAAEKLKYTPSGISRMMAALEEEQGFPLLLRQRDGVRPTADCERMLPAIRELLFRGEACRQLAAQIRGLDVGTAVIGTAYSAYYMRLAQIASEFHQQHPGIQVQIRSGYSSELLALMEQHQIDICIISRREGNHDWLPLCEDRMVAWVPAHHPMAGMPAFPLSLFETEPYIDTYPGMDVDNTRIFAGCHIRPNTQFSTMDSFATYSMVEAGLGISMNNALNGITENGTVKVLPLDPPQTVEIGIAASRDMSLAARAFFDFIRAGLSKDKGFYPGSGLCDT